MWVYESSMEVKASAEKIWELMIDVANWKKWVGSIEYSNINGKFENGAIVNTKSLNGLKSTFYLKDVVVNKSFTIQTKLPLCTLDFIHELENENNGIKIKLGVKIYGLFSFFFKAILGKNFEKSLPISVKKLIEMVMK